MNISSVYSVPVCTSIKIVFYSAIKQCPVNPTSKFHTSNVLFHVTAICALAPSPHSAILFLIIENVAISTDKELERLYKIDANSKRVRKSLQELAEDGIYSK